MSAWPLLPFDEAVEDASSGNLKTKQNDYAEQGSFAIVDQGKALIAGYTDDPAALCKAKRPVVVFGDHTRCLKYVDFPFGMGADGVKVLRPRVELDVKFLYHFLRQLKLPDGGYDRHFKYLKRESVPVPPLEEQRRIAAILDQAETLRTQRRQALAHLDTLTQSLFLDMFGDGNTPEPSIGELLEKKVLLLHKDGNHGSLYPRAEEFGDEGVPFLSARCVSDGGEIQEQFIDRLQDQKANQLRIGWIEKGDVLLAHNASVGKVALYDGRYKRALIGTSLTAFRADQSILSPEFLAAAFRSTKFQAQLFKNMGQTTRNQVPITAQRELKVALPPLALQQTFATRIQAIEALKATHRAALAQLDALFASLQQRAFAGEL
ncbi:MAG: restriction endonuclease subunit S [Ramlibacter sp.]